VPDVVNGLIARFLGSRVVAGETCHAGLAQGCLCLRCSL
jgi:hypothetical protein